MKKFLCTFLFIFILASIAYSAEKSVIRLGLLTKMNSTEEQFMDTWKKTFKPVNQNLEVIIKFYDSLTLMQMALNAGEIHEMVLPDFAAEYVMNRNKDLTSKLVLRSRGMGLSFGFRNDNKELCEKFNEALNVLRDDWTLSALEGEYIASPGLKEPEPVKFTRLDDAETIRVAVTGDLPPVDYIAADGTPAGFNTAVLSEIGQYLRKNIELVEIDSGARTAALASGRVDVVFWYEIDKSAGIQSDVPEGVILSEPYYEWDKFIHVRKAEKSGGSSMFDWNIKRGLMNMFNNTRN